MPLARAIPRRKFLTASVNGRKRHLENSECRFVDKACRREGSGFLRIAKRVEISPVIIPRSWRDAAFGKYARSHVRERWESPKTNRRLALRKETKWKEAETRLPPSARLIARCGRTDVTPFYRRVSYLSHTKSSYIFYRLSVPLGEIPRMAALSARITLSRGMLISSIFFEILSDHRWSYNCKTLHKMQRFFLILKSSII